MTTQLQAKPRTTISAKNLERYTYGDCYLLAWHLHQQSGWPVVLVTASPSSPEAAGDWNHVVVKSPEGIYLDIKGAHEEEALRHSWSYGGDILLEELSQAHLTSWEAYNSFLWAGEEVDDWGTRGGSRRGLLQPEEVARRVLARL